MSGSKQHQHESHQSCSLLRPQFTCQATDSVLLHLLPRASVRVQEAVDNAMFGGGEATLGGTGGACLLADVMWHVPSVVLRTFFPAFLQNKFLNRARKYVGQPLRRVCKQTS